jgi:hypothetical protein
MQKNSSRRTLRECSWRGSLALCLGKHAYFWTRDPVYNWSFPVDGIRPSSQTAWESVYYLQDVMTGGWLLRGLHHFTAHVMIVLLALHLMQVVIGRRIQSSAGDQFLVRADSPPAGPRPGFDRVSASVGPKRILGYQSCNQSHGLPSQSWGRRSKL